MAERPDGNREPAREGREIFEELSSHDRARLVRVAESFVGGLLIGAEDLLHEALVNVLAGERRWPRRMAAFPFVIGVMKSLASSHRKSLKRQKRWADDHGNPGPPDEPWTEPAVPWEDPVEEWIRECFPDDARAAAVVRGITAGFRGGPLAEHAGVGFPRELATIRKRIRRAFARYRRGGAP